MNTQVPRGRVVQRLDLTAVVAYMAHGSASMGIGLEWMGWDLSIFRGVENFGEKPRFPGGVRESTPMYYTIVYSVQYCHHSHTTRAITAIKTDCCCI